MRINLEKLRERGIEVELAEEHLNFVTYNTDCGPIELMMKKYGIVTPGAQDVLISGTLKALSQAVVLDCME